MQPFFFASSNNFPPCGVEHCITKSGCVEDYRSGTFSVLFCQKTLQGDLKNDCSLKLLPAPSQIKNNWPWNKMFFFSFQFPAHKTILCCFFTDIYKWDKIPAFLTDLSPDVLRGLLHYIYTCCLPRDLSEDTAKKLMRISQLNSNDVGSLGELCVEFLEATAVKNSEYFYKALEEFWGLKDFWH